MYTTRRLKKVQLPKIFISLEDSILLSGIVFKALTEVKRALAICHQDYVQTKKDSRRIGHSNTKQEVVAKKCSSDRSFPILSGRNYQTQFLVLVQNSIISYRLSQRARLNYLLNFQMRTSKYLNRNTSLSVCVTK